jgi:hypothetical protein
MIWLVILIACASEPPGTPAPHPIEESPPPAPTPTPAPTPPVFWATSEPIPPEMREQMLGNGYREDCPVGLDELRLIRMTHWTFDGRVVEGQLIVAAQVVEPVREAFAAAFDERFPIERMEPVHAYGGDDDRSMAANNTSAFNCRPVAGTSQWSQHAYGTAIDVNPVQNPYVRGERVDPPAGREYVDRTRERPGMLEPGSALVRELHEHGWGWGGTWGGARKDWQHLSATGR